MMLVLLALSLLPPTADVRITNSHLVVTCVAGKPVDGAERHWGLTQTTSFAFTMRNEPRPGIENREAGVAVISFTPEAEHRYEIEVRGDAASYSRRVWARGDWQPVVRDRTTNTIVSSEPKWIASGCN